VVRENSNRLNRPSNPEILPETAILLLICMADMIQTVYVVGSGQAIEANPVLAAAMDYSPWAFMGLKSVTFLAPLGAVELLRPRSPNFIRLALRLGALAYLAVYLVGTLHINNVVPVPH
jgi:hypothetical protein